MKDEIDKRRVSILRARLKRALERAILPRTGDVFTAKEIKMRVARIMAHAAHLGWLRAIPPASPSEIL